ncbi:MAG: TonB-dependent receptor [Bacteroidetes bacterium]|nr:TonB-dependent receptor [Bacteroidota bacterium]
MRKLMLLLCLVMSSYLLQAQNFSIKVSDSKTGNPVTNASATVRGSGKGASANSDGMISIQAPANSTVDISCVGYKPQSVKLSGSATIVVMLEPSSVDLGDIVVVGSRSGGRAKTETAVPVDVIKINQVGISSAKMDMTSVLNMAAPSFNYNKQSGADGADHLDLGTLRGLGPDQTLVLINGKRRHQTAFVGLFGSRGRGNSGADLNALPQSIVDRIEILRDGASAQYGSDAMAGVINIVLKKDINKWSINTGWSGYYDTKYNANRAYDPTQYYTGKDIDGQTFNFSVNNGFAIGHNGGFINLSFDYLKTGKTYRQVPDTNVQTNSKALPLNSSRRAFGDGSVQTDGAMYNMELPLGKDTKTVFYSFGGYNHKASDAFAYTRNLSARPDRFPVDVNGTPIFVPGIMRKSSDGEIFYNPHIVTDINDASVSAGFKGQTHCRWNWDISYTTGKNDFQYYGDKTFNASLIGNITKNNFYDGGFRFRQSTVNIDLNKDFKMVLQGLNVGLGAEYRHEKYRIDMGEEASWKGYPNAFDQAPGSQGFPGFSPADTIHAKRHSFSFYADGELNVTKKWLVEAALRFENYSDFGSLLTYKFATRYKVADNFNIRASASSGFRAPSLQQINFSNTLTSFSGGQLVQSRIARNGDAITKAAGIPDLKEEKSINASLGFAWKVMKGLTFTLDGYMIKIKDRIVLSGLFDASDATLPAAFTSQLNGLGVQTAQFFDNAVNTTNFGVDVVLDYSTKVGKKGNFKALLAGNFQKMKVDDVHVPVALDDSYRHRKTFFSDREEAFLLASAPQAKGTLSLNYSIGNLGVGINLNYFGKMKSLGFGWTGLASAAGTGGPGDPAISGSFTGIDPYVDIDGYSDGVHVVKEEFIYRGKLTTDLYVSYKIYKGISIYVGADNIANVHPDFAAVKNARYEAFDNEAGGPWESVQMGFNGRKLFAKLAFNF